MTNKSKKIFEKNAKIIYSTIISLCLEKLDWTKNEKTKGGIKLHIMKDADTLRIPEESVRIPEIIIITNAKVHDIKGIKNIIDFKENEIYVYDRSYLYYKYLISIEKAYFITGIKKCLL